MQSYKDLKIAFIYGQGIEGCGVTRGAVEFQLWAKKNNVVAHIYALNEKKYVRGNAHNFEHIDFFSKYQIEEYAKKINDNYDIVMFNNYPHNKFDHDIIKSFYFDLFLKIEKPIKVSFFHEIHKMNLDKIGFLVPMIINSDLVFHFDTDTWFSKTVDQLGFKKIGDRLNKYTLWMNFDELDNYRQKYLNNKKPGLVSVTRWSSLKNIKRSIDIMAELQKLRSTWDCEVRGVERSIGAKFDILDYEKTIYVNSSSKKDNEEKGEVLVYGPVSRNEGLDIVASHEFSSSFFSLPSKPENYGNRMEYTQLEIIGVGAIPVFDKHWAMNNKTCDGQYYYDIPCSAIYTDGTDIETVAQKIINISEIKDLKEKYLETSYSLIKKEFDADIVIPKTIDLILSKGKINKTKSLYEICDEFVNKEFANGIAELIEDNKLPCLGIGEFENPGLFYLNGAKQELYKKVEKPKKNKNVKSLF